jgi:hypothetical protein
MSNDVPEECGVPAVPGIQAGPKAQGASWRGPHIGLRDRVPDKVMAQDGKLLSRLTDQVCGVCVCVCVCVCVYASVCVCVPVCLCV